MASIPYKDRKFDKDNKRAYDSNYRRENLDQVNLLLPKGYKDRIKEKAAEQGISMNEWIRNLIDNTL